MTTPAQDAVLTEAETLDAYDIQDILRSLELSVVTIERNGGKADCHRHLLAKWHAIMEAMGIDRYSAQDVKVNIPALIRTIHARDAVIAELREAFQIYFSFYEEGYTEFNKKYGAIEGDEIIRRARAALVNSGGAK